MHKPCNSHQILPLPPARPAGQIYPAPDFHPALGPASPLRGIAPGRCSRHVATAVRACDVGHGARAARLRGRYAGCRVRHDCRRGPVRPAVACASGGARIPGRRMDRRASGPPAGRPQASGRGLPVHVLLVRVRRRLRRWHPGAGVLLADADPADFGPDYTLTAAGSPSTRHGVRARRGEAIAWIREAARGAPPSGRPSSAASALHEWAMVYRQPRTSSATRTGRCGSAAADRPRSSRRQPVRCSHFDAFRFFTPGGPAAERAAADPGHAGRPRTAGLPAREHGPLQVGVQAVAAGSRRTGRRTASRWPGRSGRSTCRPARTTSPALGYQPVRIETAGGQGRVRRGASGSSPIGPPSSAYG